MKPTPPTASESQSDPRPASGANARGLRAAQYLRVSTGSQVYSLENQSAIIAEYASERGYEVVRTYADVGRSGVTQKGRGGLARLLEDVQGEIPFTVLLVVDVTRWGRYQNPDEAAYLEFACLKAGVRVEYCTEGFGDVTEPSSSIQKTLKRVMAAEYSLQLSAKVRAGKRRRAMAGGRQGGSAPYGFRRCAMTEDGRPEKLLEPGERALRPGQAVGLAHGPESEVATIRMIFDLFVREKLQLVEIARRLNDGGAPRHRPGPWGASCVGAILRNELVVGVFCFNRMRTRFEKIEAIHPESEWIRVRVVDPLVEDTVFAAATERLAQRYHCQHTEAELLGHLRRLYKTHGRVTHSLMALDPLCPHWSTFINRFGTMNEARWAARLPPTQIKRKRPSLLSLSEDVLLDRLLALREEQGRLTFCLIDARDDLPRAEAIASHYGGMSGLKALLDRQIKAEPSGNHPLKPGLGSIRPEPEPPAPSP